MRQLHLGDQQFNLLTKMHLYQKFDYTYVIGGLFIITWHGHVGFYQLQTFPMKRFMLSVPVFRHFPLNFMSNVRKVTNDQGDGIWDHVFLSHPKIVPGWCLPYLRTRVKPTSNWFSNFQNRVYHPFYVTDLKYMVPGNGIQSAGCSVLL